MDINKDDFDYIRDLVRRSSAIALEEGKEYLVEARLMPVANEEGIGSIEDLVAKLRVHPQNELHNKVVEAMTTNETSWFRDIQPFETLKNFVLPELLKKREAERSLNIWCAACSSGQEPYSIAMLFREHFPELARWRVRFVASDISSEMLARAREGCYSQIEVNRGLPAPLLVKYFQKNGLKWQIKGDIIKMVEFQQINLATSWPVLPTMDVIFMRNVLIYFDTKTKKAILGKVRQVLKPDGYLFLGGAETTINIDSSFEKVRMENVTCYVLRGA